MPYPLCFNDFMQFYRIFAILLLVLPAGCASVPRDAGFADVQADIARRLDETVQWRQGGVEDAAVDERVKQLLAQTLTAEAAVQVALLNHRGLQAEYEELGVAQADLVQAGLLRKPVLGWSRQEGGGLIKTVLGVEVDFLGILLAASQKRIEDIRFRHVKLRVSQAVLRHAAETRKAWVDALAAEQSAGFLAQVKELADAEAELGARQRKAGNVGQRDWLRQQAFAAETGVELAQARQTAFAARERLNRLMGLSGEQVAWQLPSRLPEMPGKLPQYADLESYGIAQRLDVRQAQVEAEAFSAVLGLTRDSRFIHVLDLGVETEKNTGEKRITGPTLKLELPIFDQGQARLSRQQALYRQSEQRLYEAAVNARSEIREAWQRTATAHATAQHVREILVPLRRKIVEESTLHYNGMLIGVYDLLADAREQVNAVQKEIDAGRDYWVALADLQLAVGGKLPAAETVSAASGNPASPVKAAPAAAEHAGHRHQE